MTREMADGSTSEQQPALTLATVGAIADVPAAAWDACAGADNPFVGHAFLSALEASRSAVAETGWRPMHLVARDRDQRVVGVVPLYLKSHSYGEYVFDWAWAEALQRAGGRYYPKLLAAVPFTPVPGPRLLAHPAAPPGTTRVLAAALRRLAESARVSSLHVNFLAESDVEPLTAAGLLSRRGLQYHWPNEGYGHFEDFLARLSARKRKAIRRERASVANSGLVVRSLVSDAIEPRHWRAFWDFYRNTAAEKWGHAYLTRAFFARLALTMGERLLMVAAETPDGRPVAGALNVIGGDALYGRYWGATVDVPFLHFELCYYRAIEAAIARGLKRVEAGAQGEHKLARGYLPVITRSAHWLADPGLEAAVARFLDDEQDAIATRREELLITSPYRRGGESVGGAS